MQETEKINHYFTDLYYYLHPQHTEKITHHALRILQQIYKGNNVTVKTIALKNEISHNTASEHVKRLIQKGYIEKKRKTEDERVVLLSLTSDGLKILKENTELSEERLELILNRLSSGKRDVVIEGFRILAEEAVLCFSY